MIEESATRFNNGTWLKTSLDTETSRCEITGFIDNEPVQYSYNIEEVIKKLIDRSIESLIFPADLTAVGAYAFDGCASLKNAVIPEGVTAVGNSAFAGCTNLKSVDYPSTVTSMGTYVHSYNSALETFTIRATTPPTLGTSSITGVAANCIFYVPAASVAAYKAADGWSARADKIQAIV